MLTDTGPSVFGKIPNFTQSIFPAESITNITLVANIGMIMFLFIVGLEVDLTYVKKNIKIASVVGIGSVVVPFGIGAALSYGLYTEFSDPSISFGTFLLFVGLSMAVTEFPVLARILSEIGLLKDRVRIIVIAAGVGNDLMSWILLALAITLSNSSHAINTLYIILLTISWVLILVFLVYPSLNRYLKYSGGIENGPSQSDMALIFLLVFVSSFYTDIIGVHSIFGAFLVGVVIPRKNLFVMRVTEKIEDFISVALLPIYFTVAGLDLDLGLLNDGITWGYVIAILSVAIGSKLIGVSMPAKLLGLRWRESLAVGVLMSCKGAVEIVILQVGLHTGILNHKQFSMLVLMTIFTTFITAPLTLKIYPQWYREKVQLWRSKHINWDGTPTIKTKRSSLSIVAAQDLYKFKTVMIVLDDIHSLSTNMVFTQLITCSGPMSDDNEVQLRSVKSNKEYCSPQRPNSKGSRRNSGIITPTTTTHPDGMLLPIRTMMSHASTPAVNEDLSVLIQGVRIHELSQRTASLIQLMSEQEDEISESDPILKVFNIFAGINAIPFMGKLAVVSANEKPHFIANAPASSSDFLLLTVDESKSSDGNVVENHNRYSAYDSIMMLTKNPTGVLVDRGFSIGSDTRVKRTLYVMFFGFPDCRQALATALQLAKSSLVEIVIDDLSSHRGLQHLELSSEYEGVEAEYIDLVIESCSHDIFEKIKVNRTADKSLSGCKKKLEQMNLKTNDLTILGRNITETPSHGEHILGRLAGELMKSPNTKCSFLVCQSVSVPGSGISISV